MLCLYSTIYHFFTAILVFLSVPSIYGILDRPTEMLIHNSRRHIGPEFLWLYKQRVRRAEPDCSNEAEKNVELQQAIATMIIGSDDKSYLTHTQTTHKHRSKITLEKSALCDEDNGPEEIAPDTPIRDRALCAFQYVENFSKQRLPQTIPEVQCVCTKPKNRMVLSRFPQIRCEAIYYDVPVIKFENGCKDFQKTTERISLACVPVLSSQMSSNLPIDTNEGENAEAPSRK